MTTGGGAGPTTPTSGSADGAGAVPAPLDVAAGGGGAGLIRANTEALVTGAQRYRDVGDALTSFAARCEPLATREPLQGGQGDSTWEKFSEDYVPGARGFVRGVTMLARAVHAVADGVDGMAGSFAATEEGATSSAAHMGGELDAAAAGDA